MFFFSLPKLRRVIATHFYLYMLFNLALHFHFIEHERERSAFLFLAAHCGF